MHCPRCQHTIESREALFCSQCGTKLQNTSVCNCCAKRLPPDVKFCTRCGTPANCIEVQNFWKPIYCNASGSAILPGDRHFKCAHCGDVFLENYRFEDQPICQNCATIDSTGTSALTDKSTEQTTVTSQVHVEGQIRPLTNIHYPGTQDRFYQNRLKKLGTTEPNWIEIPEGDFLMGSPSTEKDRFDNEIQHSVTVKSFYLFKTPVTFEMYDYYCDELKLSKPSDERWGREKRPVINITYWEAMEYCVWLKKQTGWIIRLPTEAEWEYACRAGTKTTFSTGETITTDQANFDGNYTYRGSPKGIRLGMTSPVDQFSPNPWGIHDMHGNVWEWCASVFDENYTGQEQADAGGLPDDLHERVVRGGSWYNVPSGLRSAIRNKMGPNYHYLRIGFRLVREAQ